MLGGPGDPCGAEHHQPRYRRPPGPSPQCPRLPLSLCVPADPSGISPLAWLLGEYLGSAEQSCSGAFGSCVRRLTQLLVHVDPGAEPVEAGAAGERRVAFMRGQARGGCVRG